MLLLKLGINQIYVTISELNTINNPVYTLIIKEETTHIEKSIIILDTSTNAIRYNKFQVELVNDPAMEDLANGIVYLNEGKHNYTIMTSTAIGILPALSMICEYGIVKVLKSIPLPDKSYTSYIPETIYKSYTDYL